LYFVPSETLVEIETAQRLGIHTEDDLFGGVVPSPFVGTKSITHPLIDPNAFAPSGWSHRFADCVFGVVLPGFTVFSHRDALQAAECLLQRGSVRLKPARGIGGLGQVAICQLAEVEAFLSTIDSAELACYGLVLERNLTDVTTYSVGQVRVDDLIASYHGKQRLTTDNAGSTAYGGSDLVVVRGDYEVLLGLDLEPATLLAIGQARVYDAATVEFPGLIASRRNYDVIQGRDSEGHWRSGVLEQSWRLGGASGPEVAALQAFRSDPELNQVRAWCLEIFGQSEEPPPHAIVHFRGVDDRIGFLTKYTVVEAYGRAD
jgi:hypothetical protein